MYNQMPKIGQPEWNRKILETCNLAKLNQEESENLSKLITKEFETEIKHSQQTRVLDWITSQMDFTKHSKKN